MFRIAHMQAELLNPIVSLHTHAFQESKPNFHIKHQYEIIESWKPKKKSDFLRTTMTMESHLLKILLIF